MGKIIKTLTFTLALCLINRVTLAFNLPQRELEVGMPVYIDEADPLRYYAVFLPSEEPTDGQVCASMTGEELAEDNNLRDYGTCFINDAGIFTIVEIVEEFSSSYDKLKEDDQILQEEIITLVFTDDFQDMVKTYVQETTLSMETEETTGTSQSTESVLGLKIVNYKKIFLEYWMFGLALSLFGLFIFLLLEIYTGYRKKK